MNDISLQKKESVLITGADGFIGSHLTELLVREGYKVKALSQYNSFNYWGWLEDIECRNEIEVLNGDVRDPHYCKHITKDTDIVFHLAALIAIPYSYVAPDSYLDTNVKGTLNICQAAMENGVKRVIHTSTSEVYGTAQYVPIDEKHPLQPQSPYSASKIAADAMAMSFFNAFDLPLTIARPFNTYGPRQSARAVIPTIISQIANGKKQIKLGDVSPTRDFNYVSSYTKFVVRISLINDSAGTNPAISLNVNISRNIRTWGNIDEVFANHVVTDGYVEIKNIEITHFDTVGESNAGADNHSHSACKGLQLPSTEGRARMDQVGKPQQVRIARRDFAPH